MNVRSLIETIVAIFAWIGHGVRPFLWVDDFGGGRPLSQEIPTQTGHIKSSDFTQSDMTSLRRESLHRCSDGRGQTGWQPGQRNGQRDEFGLSLLDQSQTGQDRNRQHQDAKAQARLNEGDAPEPIAGLLYRHLSQGYDVEKHLIELCGIRAVGEVHVLGTVCQGPVVDDRHCLRSKHQRSNSLGSTSINQLPAQTGLIRMSEIA